MSVCSLNAVEQSEREISASSKKRQELQVLVKGNESNRVKTAESQAGHKLLRGVPGRVQAAITRE